MEEENKCYICGEQREIKDNDIFLCETCLARHDFKCYKISISPLLLKYYCDRSQTLSEEIVKLKGKWFIIDRILNYVGEKGINTSATDIMQYLSIVKNSTKNFK